MKPSERKKILFITPLASRTGSEMMLFNVIHRLDRSKYEIALASYKEGELLQELPSDVKVYRVPGEFSLRDRISYHLGRHPIAAALKKIQKEFKADLWYLNTIVLPNAAETASALNVPFVVHFHEMPLSYIYVNKTAFDTIIDKSHHIIGCSEATCLGIRQAGARNVSLIYEFIREIEEPADKEEIQKIRASYGIAPDHFVWLMSGVPSERKGFDLFPDIAAELDDERVHLVWVGGGAAEDGYLRWARNRIEHNTSRTRIHMAGKQKEKYAQYLHAADGFLLTSRQDPFPLVMLEAASLGKPIVSFPSGGVSELLVDGMGQVTEDISVRQLVAAMKKVMNGETVCNPAVSKERVKAFTLDEGMRRWTEVMDQIIFG